MPTKRLAETPLIVSRNGRLARSFRRRWSTLPTLCLAILSVLLLVGSAEAGPLATWTPSYASGGNAPYAVSTADPANFGSGSLVYNSPVSSDLTTGTSTFAFTGTATGAASFYDGYYGVSQNDGGVVLQYTCSLTCTTGPHTVTFFWNLTYNWTLTTKCPVLTSENAHVTISVISEVIDQASYTVVGSATTTVDNALLNSCSGSVTTSTSSNAGAVPETSVVSMSLSVGHTYNFTSFVHADGYASVCYPNGPCSGISAAEFSRVHVDFASGSNGAILGRIDLN
jgi:hypothetical protein